MTDRVLLEVFSDYVCPWCYLNTARIQRLRQAYAIDVRYVHFPLHPKTPPEGLTLEELFADRDFDAQAAQAKMQALMEAEGLPYGERRMTFNSRLAQELAVWARELPGGEAIHDVLFRAYFVEGRNIAQAGVLLAAAAEAGLDPEAAAEVINSRSRQRDVDADWRRCKALGVTGVPTYLADGRAIVGAQPYEALEKFILDAGAQPRNDL